MKFVICNILTMVSFLTLLGLLVATGQSVNAIYTVNRDYGNCENVIEGFDNAGPFKPTWDSLDSRKLPVWYDDAKFGIFIHWGVFSVPSFGSEWFWRQWKSNSKHINEFMKQRYPPNFTYQDFAKEFTAEFYNATQWSNIFKASGAKYVVLTSKHHEGYTLWPSKRSFSWNSVDVGPNRDLVGELADAIRANTDIKFGLYHSLFEWFNPLWLADLENNFTSNDFVMTKTLPELMELVNIYKPEVIWSDGEWDAPDTYWKSKEFLAWLYNQSPVKETVVVNDRWGHETGCHHGDFYNCADRYNPGTLQPHKWENALTIDKESWGYRRDAHLSDYLDLNELIKELVVTVSCGGNMLLNVGPTKDGIIAPIFEERLRQIGDWLSENGEAIYDTRPYSMQNDTVDGNVWWTQNKVKKTLYGSILQWPKDNILRVTPIKLSEEYRVCLLGPGCKTELKWANTASALEIKLPVEEHRGKPAWVFRVEYLGPHKASRKGRKH